jgi:hypothetical protein
MWYNCLNGQGKTKGENEMDKNIIANELRNVGFKVKVMYVGVEVTLDNRKVNTMEVKHALDQIFGDIEFNVMSSRNGVVVN